jgi:hypothetical protein
MSHLFKNLIIALGVTILVGVLYFTFFRKDTTDTAVVTDEKSKAELQTERIQSDIEKIKKYKVEDNSSLFKDSGFLSLKNYRVKIQDVDTSRANPFEPAQ